MEGPTAPARDPPEDHRLVTYYRGSDAQLRRRHPRRL